MNDRTHYRLFFRCSRCTGAGQGHGTKVVVAGPKADPIMAQMHRHGLTCPVCARTMRLEQVEEFTPEADPGQLDLGPVPDPAAGICLGMAAARSARAGG